MQKGYIESNNYVLFGKNNIVGYSNGKIYVKVIDRNLANELIKKHHYSKKFYSASYIHLGVFDNNNKLVGVIQYGYAMNPASAESIVSDTRKHEYLELNRLWIDDFMDKNTASMAISCSIKYIKRAYPKIKWIQSFADERCKRFGIVYQACSFDYYGSHESLFWEINNEFYHNSLMTRNPELTKAAAFCQEHKDIAIKHTFRQFRYIKFLDRRYKKKCKLKEHSYPKHYYTGG